MSAYSGLHRLYGTRKRHVDTIASFIYFHKGVIRCGTTCWCRRQYVSCLHGRRVDAQSTRDLRTSLCTPLRVLRCARQLCASGALISRNLALHCARVAQLRCRALATPLGALRVGRELETGNDYQSVMPKCGTFLGARKTRPNWVNNTARGTPRTCEVVCQVMLESLQLC
jgi:hypothetical protein